MHAGCTQHTLGTDRLHGPSGPNHDVNGYGNAFDAKVMMDALIFVLTLLGSVFVIAFVLIVAICMVCYSALLWFTLFFFAALQCSLRVCCIALLWSAV